MKQYTERELDKKIRAFITSKTDQFPELTKVKATTINQAMEARGKTSILHDIFSNKLKPSFK
jgi:hypothetical protein